MGVKGSADSLVEFGDGTSEVEEYKTKKMTGMWAALKKGTLPEDAHVNQGLTYAFALKYHGAEDIPPLGDRMRGVRVVYFSKGDEAIREYVRDLTPEWEDSFIDFMGRMDRYRTAGEGSRGPLPLYPRLPEGSWPCDYCPYKTRCWTVDGEGVLI
jgi:hypothetical protein